MKRSILNRIVWGIQRRALNLFLRGNYVHCPVCSTGFVTFLPYGVRRANAQCPNCGSLERTRLFWFYLNSKRFFDEAGVHILHVAPEMCLSKKFKGMKEVTYVPVDKFTEGWNYPRGTQKVDITNTQFAPDSFDFILCSHVLEHITDDKVAMAELYRIMKPGGFGILQVPMETSRSVTFEDPSIIDPAERERVYGQFDHVRIYGSDYAERLRSVGFKVSVIDIYGSLSPDERFRLGFLPGEDLYVVHKEAR